MNKLITELRELGYAVEPYETDNRSFDILKDGTWLARIYLVDYE